MNKKVDDKWTKDLRKRMEDYSEPLPKGLWEELEGELAQPKIIPFWRKWPSVAAAVALVLIVSSLALSEWFSPMKDSSDMRLANELAPELTTDLLSEPLPKLVPEKTPMLASENSLHTVKNLAVNTSSSTLRSETIRKETADNEILSVENEDIKDEEYGDEANQKVIGMNEMENNRNSRSPKRTRLTADCAYTGYQKKKFTGKGVELGLHTGGIPYGTSKEFTGMSRMAASRHTLDAKNQLMMGSMNGNMSAYSQVLFNNRDKQTHTDVKHRMPINVVASVKWHFAKDWALESGLSYTFLQSELHSGSNLYWEETQKLHYVGIPIKLHRTIWENSALSLYASAGGMVEKCVSGSLESIYVTSSSTREKENHSIHSHPFQWSVAAAVGAQVNLIRSLSLFVEPGIAYYFDDNSPIETIRKEHPFNFNLQFGLRLDLSR